jgi:hypothetical protein
MTGSVSEGVEDRDCNFKLGTPLPQPSPYWGEGICHCRAVEVA